MIEIFALNLTRQLTQPVEKFLPLFTPERQEKILRHKFLADRNRTLWTELLARSIIAKKISRPIQDIFIDRDENGKPHVRDCDLKISLAHSEHYAVCSVGDVSSGVYVEENSDDALIIAKNFFSIREYKMLLTLDGQARAEKFLCLWTLKESFAKLTGRNLEDVLKLDAEIFGGKNFFVDGAVIGVCADDNFTAKNFSRPVFRHVTAEKIFQSLFTERRLCYHCAMNHARRFSYESLHIRPAEI